MEVSGKNDDTLYWFLLLQPKSKDRNATKCSISKCTSLTENSTITNNLLVTLLNKLTTDPYNISYLNPKKNHYNISIIFVMVLP